MKGAKTFLTICAFYNVLLGVLFALFPAAILRRFGVEATIRASLAFYNGCEDIDALVSALHHIQSGRS